MACCSAVVALRASSQAWSSSAVRFCAKTVVAAASNATRKSRFMKTFPVEFFDMARPRFVHLRMHSEYSVNDGIVRIDDAVERAAADYMPALALTDAANLFGMVKFYGAARAAGVKPVIGVDCWLQNEAEREKPFRLLLLCSSRAGYRRLCDLLSRAWLKNHHRGRAEIASAWLEEAGSDGLIALSGAAPAEAGAAPPPQHAAVPEPRARPGA